MEKMTMSWHWNEKLLFYAEAREQRGEYLPGKSEDRAEIPSTHIDTSPVWWDLLYSSDFEGKDGIPRAIWLTKLAKPRHSGLKWETLPQRIR